MEEKESNVDDSGFGMTDDDRLRFLFFGVQGLELSLLWWLVFQGLGFRDRGLGLRLLRGLCLGLIFQDFG